MSKNVEFLFFFVLSFSRHYHSLCSYCARAYNRANLTFFRLCFFSSADALDTAPAGRRAAGLQRDAGVFHGGASHVAALLDARQRANVARQRQVQGHVHTGHPFVQGANEADHCGRVADRLRRVQVRGEELARRDRRHDSSVQ